MKHTFIFFDDKFPFIAHTDWNHFSVLPQWIDRMVEIIEYKVIDKHGKKIQ